MRPVGMPGPDPREAECVKRAWLNEKGDGLGCEKQRNQGGGRDIHTQHQCWKPGIERTVLHGFPHSLTSSGEDGREKVQFPTLDKFRQEAQPTKEGPNICLLYRTLT